MTITQMCAVIEREQNLDKSDPSIMLPNKSQSWSMPLFGGIFNIFESMFSLFYFYNKSRKEKGIHIPTMAQVIQFFGALVFPFVPLYAIYSSAIIDPKQKNKLVNILTTSVYGLCFIAWVILFFLGSVNHGFVAFGWTLFVINACILTGLRMHFREVLGYHGNVVGDFVASSILYPQALTQMMMELGSDNVKTYLAANHND